MTSFANHQRRRSRREASPATLGEVSLNCDAFRANDLRRRCFAAGEELCRRGVTPTDVEAHVSMALSLLTGTALEPERAHITDLTLAVAVCMGRAGAWQELLAEHEPILSHSAQAHLPQSQAILLTRRLLCRVRRQSEEGAAGVLSLRRYTGISPLRTWLLERLVAAIYSERARHGADPKVERGLSPAARLRLGARLVQIDGMPVQQAARIVGLRERDVRRAASRQIDSRRFLRELPPREQADSGIAPAT